MSNSAIRGIQAVKGSVSIYHIKHRKCAIFHHTVNGFCGQSLGAAIFSAVSLENPALPSDLLIGFKRVAETCLDPDGIYLTVVV